jgi:hypothetical protein
MSDAWYYAEDEKICGPVSLEDLETVLSIVPDPYNLRVWKAGFPDWTGAGAVREVAALIRTPPPLPEKRNKQAGETKPPPLRPPLSVSQDSTAGNKNNSSTVKRRWSLKRAFIGGLLVMGLVFVLHLGMISAGNRPPDPWLSTDINPLELISHWIGFFAVGPLLFVVFAMIRNSFVTR